MPFIPLGQDSLFFEYHAADTPSKEVPLILIHGNAMDHDVFHAIIPELTKSFEVYTYDLRGFGQSPLASKPLTWATYCEDLLHLIRSLGLPRFHLAGLGFGGILGMKFALLYPNLVETLVLMSFPFYPGHLLDSVNQHRNGITKGGTIVVRDFIQDLMTTLPQNHPDRAHIGQGSFSISTYVRLMEMSHSPGLLADLSRVTTPTLLISGERDVVYPPYLSALAAFYLPDYKFFTVPGAAYFVVLDQPNLTAVFMTRFILKATTPFPVPDAFIQSFYNTMRSQIPTALELGQRKISAVGELRVELIGGFHVTVNGEEIFHGWNQRSAKKLFVYLVFHQTATREQICDDLWPEIPYAKSRRALRVYLSHLRTVLRSVDGREFLVTDHEHVSLQGVIHCDVLNLFNLVSHAVQESDATRKLLMVKTVLHTLASDAPISVYEDWFLDLRAETERHLANLVDWVCTYLTEQDHAAEARHYKALWNHIYGMDE